MRMLFKFDDHIPCWNEVIEGFQIHDSELMKSLVPALIGCKGASLM